MASSIGDPKPAMSKPVRDPVEVRKKGPRLVFRCGIEGQST